MAPNTITHWINNKPYPGASGATAAVTNLASGAGTVDLTVFRPDTLSDVRRGGCRDDDTGCCGEKEAG
jgi:hypothetical protein